MMFLLITDTLSSNEVFGKVELLLNVNENVAQRCSVLLWSTSPFARAMESHIAFAEQNLPRSTELHLLSLPVWMAQHAAGTRRR
jgi:hypothetical protein